MPLECHYGWVALAACALCTASSASGHSYALAPFIDEWMDEVHISRSTISIFWVCAMLLSAASMPLLGPLLDQYGGRRAVCCCIPVAVCTLLWYSYASTPIELLAAISINRVVSADTLPLVGQVTLNKWFVRFRGKASIVLGVMTAWMLFFPGLEMWLRYQAGSRRVAYQIIAAYVAVIGGIAALSLRDSPESMGLLPDLARKDPANDGNDGTASKKGTLPTGDAASTSQIAEEICLNRAQAMRTIMFWAVNLSTINTSLLWVGCHFHLLDLLRFKGLDPTAASQFYMMVSVSRLSVSILLGSCCLDRLDRKSYLLLALQGLPQTLVILLLLGYIGPGQWQPWMAKVFGCIFGIWGGIFTAVGNVMFAQLFGRAHLGAISGVGKSFSLCAGALGPEILGIARDRTGSYSVVLFVYLFSTVGVTGLLLIAPMPQSPAKPEAQLTGTSWNTAINVARPRTYKPLAKLDDTLPTRVFGHALTDTVENDSILKEDDTEAPTEPAPF